MNRIPQEITGYLNYTTSKNSLTRVAGVRFKASGVGVGTFLNGGHYDKKIQIW